MADLSQLESALVKADAAGDVDGAKTLAAEIRRMRSPKPSAAEQIAGDHITQGAQAVAGQTPAQAIGGNPVVRFARGAADPIIGAYQLAANVNPLAQAIGYTDKLNDYLGQSEKVVQAGRAGYGSEGLDVPRLAGAVMSPANRVATSFMGSTPLLSATGAMKGAGIGAAAGASAPVTNENFWGTKGAQTAIGGMVGGAVTPVIGAAGKAGGSVANFFNPDRRVGQTFNAVAGSDQPAIVQALRTPQQALPGETVTAAEAALPAGRTEFSALQQLAAQGYDPSGYARLAQSNQAARAAQLPPANAPDVTNAMRATLEESRTAATSQLRNDALSQANVAGKVLPGLEQRIADRGAQASDAVADVRRFAGAEQRAQSLADNFTPVPGMPRVSGGAAQWTRPEEVVQLAQQRVGSEAGMSLQRGAERRFVEMQAASVGQSGHFPLQSQPILGKIDAITRNPSLGPSDIVSKAMADLRQKVAQWTDSNGVIDAQALYTIRKELGNSIKKYADETKNWDQRLTSRLQNNVQGAIDDAIEQAGGTGWRDYLRTYAERSRPIEQLDLGTRLSQALTRATGREGGTPFQGAVRNASDEIAEVFTPTQRGRVEGIVESLRRESAQTDASREGMESVRRILAERYAPPLMPNWLNPTITALKKGTQVAFNKAGEADMKRIAELMRTDPQRVAQLMEQTSANSQQGQRLMALVSALQTQPGMQTGMQIGRQ